MRVRHHLHRQLQLAATGLLALVAVALVGWLLLRPAPAVEGAGSPPDSGLSAATAEVTTPTPTTPSPTAPTPDGGLTTPVAGATVPATTIPLTAASPTSEVAAPAASVAGGQQVLFVGDGLDPAGTANDWSALAATALAGAGAPVARTVSAADGAGWASSSADGRTFSELVGESAGSGTRLVVLLGSRNDLADTAAAGRGAAAALAAARDAAPQAQLLVVAPPGLEGDGATARSALASQRTSLRGAVAGAGALYLDPDSTGWVLGTGATMSTDGAVRLTSAGQVEIADAVLPTLQRLVAAPSASAP